MNEVLNSIDDEIFIIDAVFKLQHRRKRIAADTRSAADDTPRRQPDTANDSSIADLVYSNLQGVCSR